MAVRWLLLRVRGLLGKVRRIFVRQVFRWLRQAGRRLGHRRGQPGGIVVQQRFGDGRLNVHFHAIVLDGVYVDQAAGGPRFVPLPAPTPRELAGLAQRIARKVRRLAGGAEGDGPAAEEPGSLLGQIQGASLKGRVALGPRAGWPLVRLGGGPVALAPLGELCAETEGFNLHAGVTVIKGRRERLLALCRYLLRPALCQERLTRRDDGQIVLKLKKPWRDGTRALIFTPLSFVALLASLVPPPREHLLTYHGCLAPHARRRSLVVPRAAGPLEAEEETARERPAETDSRRPEAEQRRRRRHLWAELLQRSFGLDVLGCGCGGRLRLLCFIHDPAALHAIARSLDRMAGLTPQAPRAPPRSRQAELFPDGP